MAGSHLIVAGAFAGSVTLSGSTTLTSKGKIDEFVAKYALPSYNSGTVA